MKVLCTFPGKHGDILWALPAIRALSRRLGQPVDLALSGKYSSLAPLLQAQSYIGQCWGETGAGHWPIEETAPISPREPRQLRPGKVDLLLHLGYRAWPDPDLARHTWGTLNQELYQARRRGVPDIPGRIEEAELALEEPWITVDGPGAPCELAVGFTDEWFELKVGIVTTLEPTYPSLLVVAPPVSRWVTEHPAGGYPVLPCPAWDDTARTIRTADRFLGCCSALHVLALALGKRVVLVEPSEARWNPVFYPVGQDGPRLRLVRGGDGRPTFDARHVREALDAI